MDNYTQGINSSNRYDLLISGNNNSGGVYLGGSYGKAADGVTPIMTSYSAHMYSTTTGMNVDISGTNGFTINSNGVTPLFALSGLTGELTLPQYAYGKNATDGPDSTSVMVPLTVDGSGNVYRDVNLYNTINNMTQQIEAIDNQLVTMNLDEIQKYNTEISKQLVVQGTAINTIVDFINKLHFSRTSLASIPIVHTSPGSSSPFQTDTVQSSPPVVVNFAKTTPLGSLINGLLVNTTYYLGNTTANTLTGNVSVQTLDGEWEQTFFNLTPANSGVTNYTKLKMPSPALYKSHPLIVLQYKNGTKNIQYTLNVKPDNSGYQVIIGSGPTMYITDLYLGTP